MYLKKISLNFGKMKPDYSADFLKTWSIEKLLFTKRRKNMIFSFSIWHFAERDFEKFYFYFSLVINQQKAAKMREQSAKVWLSAGKSIGPRVLWSWNPTNWSPRMCSPWPKLIRPVMRWLSNRKSGSIICELKIFFFILKIINLIR